jgi:hypothetical protein
MTNFEQQTNEELKQLEQTEGITPEQIENFARDIEGLDDAFDTRIAALRARFTEKVAEVQAPVEPSPVTKNQIAGLGGTLAEAQALTVGVDAEIMGVQDEAGKIEVAETAAVVTERTESTEEIKQAPKQPLESMGDPIIASSPRNLTEQEEVQLKTTEKALVSTIATAIAELTEYAPDKAYAFNMSLNERLVSPLVSDTILMEKDPNANYDAAETALLDKQEKENQAMYRTVYGIICKTTDQQSIDHMANTLEFMARKHYSATGDTRATRKFIEISECVLKKIAEKSNAPVKFLHHTLPVEWGASMEDPVIVRSNKDAAAARAAIEKLQREKDAAEIAEQKTIERADELEKRAREDAKNEELRAEFAAQARAIKAKEDARMAEAEEYQKNLRDLQVAAEAKKQADKEAEIQRIKNKPFDPFDMELYTNKQLLSEQMSYGQLNMLNQGVIAFNQFSFQKPKATPKEIRDFKQAFIEEQKKGTWAKYWNDYELPPDKD